MNLVYFALLVVSLFFIQGAIGGTRLPFSLPAYGVLAVAGILTVFSARGNRVSPRISCLLSATLLGGYVLARAAFSPVDYLWWTDFYMVIACLLTYLLTAFYLPETRLRSWLILALLLPALVQIVVGIRQFSRGDDFMFFGEAFNLLRPPHGRRASGFFISPIHFAGFLEAIAAFAVSFAFWSRRPGWARAGLGYVALCCYAGIAITGSRGGYLSVVFSLVAFGAMSLWVIRQWDQARFARTALAGMIGLLVLVAGATALMSRSHLLEQRLGMIGQQFERGKLDIRIYNWQAALDQFRTSPAIGTGAGTHLFYGRLFRRPQLQADPEHAHSDYLEMLAEYGIAGLAAMTVFLFAHMRSGLHATAWLTRHDLPDESGRPRSDTLALHLGVLTAVAAYLAHSVVDFNLHIPSNALLFAAIFGMLASPGTGEKSAIPTVGGWFRFALPALGIWMCAVGLPKLPGELLTEKTRVALRKRQFQDAITLGREALAKGNRDPHLYFYLGEANRALGTAIGLRTLRQPYFEAAVAYYQQGLAIFPQDENAWVRLGQALDGLKRFQEAEAAYLEALKWDPNLGVLYGYYAAHLQSRGREEEARAVLQKGQQLTAQNLAPMLENILDAPL